MKKLNLIITLAIAVLAVACGESKEVKDELVEAKIEATEEVEEMEAELEGELPEGFYGSEIEVEGAQSVDQFAQAMEGKDSMRARIATVATDVCVKKGCWMKVKTATDEEMRVTFKDYGFFVPKDIHGKEVVFEGWAYKDTTSVEDLRHYAEDGGQSAEEIAAITEPEISTTFVAEGVYIKE